MNEKVKGVKIGDVSYDFEDSETKSSVLANTNNIETALSFIDSIQEDMYEGFPVEVIAENCTVTFYRGNTFETVCSGSKSNQTRGKSSYRYRPCNDASLEPQINFTIVPNEGYTVDNLNAVMSVNGSEVAYSEVTGGNLKTPTGNLKVKGTYVVKSGVTTIEMGANQYSVTKVKQPFTITFTVTGSDSTVTA